MKKQTFEEYVPTPQMMAEVDCDGNCKDCEGFFVCWNKKSDKTISGGENLNKENCLKTISGMIQKFGEDSQIDVAIEEMSELIKELIKYKRSKIHFRERQAASRDHVVEEIGDVMFMIEYLKSIFDISDKDIQEIVLEKAKRTRERYLDGKE